VILRLFRAPVLPGRETALADFLRDRAFAGVLELDGLRSWQPGIRHDRDGAELALVSTWAGLDAILRNGRPDTPLAVTDATDMLAAGRSEHFELVWSDARQLVLDGGVLRIARLRIRANCEAAYFSELRTAADSLLGRQGLSALNVGRQTIRGEVETIVVTIWEGRAALERAIVETGHRGELFASLVRYHAGPIEIEEFEALDPRSATSASPPAAGFVAVR
jgi:heme-degrading monooxygenase HmoA